MRQVFKGDGTRARALRSSIWVFVGFGGENFLRLLSNLVLTRLLFPEAFGLMALVAVYLTGLQMFSDLGLNTSVMHSDRGEDPEFLNTIWSIQIIRGFVLWLTTCALADPVARMYGEPQLAQILPVVGITAVIQGFTTTKVALANRNLQIGIQVATRLSRQVITLTITAILAWSMGNVWSLVIGTLIGTTFGVISQHVMLKGVNNRWHFDRAIAWEVVSFGKYVFLSSIAGFTIHQSDRAILGAHVSMTELGIFSVGYLFASIPLLLSQAADGQVMQAIYRKFLTSESAEHRKKISKARFVLVFSLMFTSAFLSFSSIPLIGMLYDDRYQMAGPIMTIMSISVTAYIATNGYHGAYLSHGDSRGLFIVNFCSATIQLTLALWLIPTFGILGAILVIGLSAILSYPIRAFWAAKYKALLWKIDLLALLLGISLNILSVWFWWDALSPFLQRNGFDFLIG